MVSQNELETKNPWFLFAMKRMSSALFFVHWVPYYPVNYVRVIISYGYKGILPTQLLRKVENIYRMPYVNGFINFTKM